MKYHRRMSLSLIYLAIAFIMTIVTAACQSGAESSATPSRESSSMPTSTREITTVTPSPAPTITPVTTATPIPTATTTATPAITAPTAISRNDVAPQIDGYLAADSNHVTFIQFTSGDIQDFWRSGNQTYHQSIPFSVINQAGNQLTFDFGYGKGWPNRATGVLNGSNLTLVLPNPDGTFVNVVFSAATLADYNQAIQGIQRQVTQGNTQATVAQATANSQEAQQANMKKANAQVSSALRALAGDTDTLARDTNFDSTLQTYAKDWARMQADDTRMRKDGAKQPLTCVQLGSLQADVGGIEADRGTIEADHGSLQAVATTVNSDLKAVKQDMQSVLAAFSALQSAVAANTTGAPTPQFTQEDITNAVNAGQQQIDRSTKALQDAQNQAADYDQKAAQLLKTAQTFVAGLKCA